MGVISQKKIPPMGYFWDIIFSEMPELWHYSAINHGFIAKTTIYFMMVYHKKHLDFDKKELFFMKYCPKWAIFAQKHPI